MEAVSLSKLPVPILADIFDRDFSSFLVVSLWKCGDSTLNRKLVRAVTSLDLKDTKGDPTSRYPKLISGLTNLRSLRIDRGGDLLTATADELAHEMSLLDGSKLETLTILSPTAEQVYRRCLAHPGSTSASLLDLSFKFPALRSLTLASFMYAEPVNALPHLPPNLSFIRAAGLNVALDSGSAFASIPRFLETWYGKFSITPKNPFQDVSEIRSELTQIFKHLPPRLATINWIQPYSMPASLGFDYLPKTLNVLKGLFDFNYLTMDLLRSLPHAVKSITISGFSDSWWAQEPRAADWMALLPLQLERLELNLPMPILSVELLKHLPRSLKSFKSLGFTFGPGAVEWDAVVETITPLFWPPGLTELELPGERMPAEVVKSLPANMKILRYRQAEEEPSAAFSFGRPANATVTKPNFFS